MRFIFLTMDGNHGAALRDAAAALRREHGVALDVAVYSAAALRTPADWARLAGDVAGASFVFGALLFGEEHVRPLQQFLADAPCPVCVITSNPALIRCTRLGGFVLHQRDDGDEGGLMARWIKKFRPKGGSGEGQRQLALIRNLGRVMAHIPGKARDIASYIAVHDYWLNCSPENLRRMLAMLITRYVPGAPKLPVQEAIEYPAIALYHPDAPAPFSDMKSYEAWRAKRDARRETRDARLPLSRIVSPPLVSRVSSSGVVGILALRTVILSGNTAHLDALVRALEARGLEARVAYSAGLDMRPAIAQFFTPIAGRDDPPGRLYRRPTVDVLLNGAGFSLVGGPAESKPHEAVEVLRQLDVAYLDMVPLAFQRVEEWGRDDTGLSPMQLALNVAIPELDGAVEPLVFGGPSAAGDRHVPLDAQIELASRRVAKRVALHRTANAEKRVAVVLFNFPPNLGNAGTAAYLDVFVSLHNLLLRLKAEGYSVDVPATVEELRAEVAEGNALLHGTDGNVAATLPVAEYRRLFPAHTEIEPHWGRAPGELLSDGKGLHIMGRQYGNVFVGLQPSFGYERDPMRLLMAKNASPHHGFAAFYAWIEHVFGAHAVLHFGTHGALEFMPGKQAGLSADCWPTRLLGGLPNFYYYSVNNPSEGTIARRRSAATLISYMVPPLQQAGLYKGLRLLKDAIDSYRKRPSAVALDDIRAQAERLGLAPEAPASDEAYVTALAHELLEVEQRLIPTGLHVLGAAPNPAALADVLALVAAFHRPQGLRTLPETVAAGLGWDYEQLRAAMRHSREAQERWERVDAIVRQAMRLFVTGVTADVDVYLKHEANIAPGTLSSLWSFLGDLLARMCDEQELNGIAHALEGGYILPSPGNDVVRNPAVAPTGRNIHALDPFRVPSPAAMQAGAQLMDELLQRLEREGGAMPETVALVLWGADNLKSDCEGVAQALALLGARPVLDELGAVADVELVPLAELGRPRVDALITVSGIFRDLLTHQMALLDKAARLAAAANEPLDLNFVRKHALAQAAELRVPLEEAATRVFTNAPGSYGANVNNLVESSTWDGDEQLAEAFVSRKCFAYGAHGEWRDARGVMERALATVDATFQNVDSFEVGISDISNYYENLGGITKSVELLRGERPPVLVADAVAVGSGRLASLEQMVRLESRAKLLNPKWFEAMLAHGFEGVREIEARVGNTYGWSATAGAVDGWVYQGVADTFLLDEAMRERMAALNPHATAAVARRLLEAADRGHWQADEATLAALQDVYGDLEDRLEGVAVGTTR